MEAIILALSPVVVSYLTSFIKQIPAVDTVDKPIRKAGLKLLVAVLSAGASFGTFALGGDLDESVFEALIGTLFVFLSTSVPYWLAKLKSK